MMMTTKTTTTTMMIMRALHIDMKLRQWDQSLYIYIINFVQYKYMNERVIMRLEKINFYPVAQNCNKSDPIIKIVITRKVWETPPRQSSSSASPENSWSRWGTLWRRPPSSTVSSTHPLFSQCPPSLKSDNYEFSGPIRCPHGPRLFPHWAMASWMTHSIICIMDSRCDVRSKL